MTGALVRRLYGTAAELHAEPMPETHEVELWVMKPHAPAVVMGSAQHPDLFDQVALEADGVELAARRSGGGAVFIDPEVVVWVDVLLPKSSVLWSSELTETFVRVGRRWQQAFATLGVHLELCSTVEPSNEAARVACWASTGWGELTAGSAKVLGLSQRRTRWGARVQAMAVLDASAPRVSGYFVDPVQRALAATVEPPTPTVRQQLAGRASELERAVLNQFV